MGALRHAIMADRVDQEFLIRACTEEELVVDQAEAMKNFDKLIGKREISHG